MQKLLKNNNMINKITILFFTHIFLFYLSQTKPPESYSLIRGVNENIDLNSGTLHLNVPLFDISHGTFRLTNSLNYESRGFVPHLTPSYVGLNWSLIPFGKITRESRRIDFSTTNTGILFFLAEVDDDDKQYSNPRNNLRIDCINVGYAPIGGDRSYKKNIFNNPFEKDYSASIYFPDLTGGPFVGGYYGKAYTYEPDKFYFDFMGYKGYFVVDNEGKAIVYCENAALKVEIQNYGCHDLFGDITFSELTIIDDKGNKFVFGGTTDALDINYSYNRSLLEDAGYYFPWASIVNKSNKTNYIDSWMLKKIVLNNGQIVNAHYKQSNINVLNNYRSNVNYNGSYYTNLGIDGELYMDDNTQGFPDKQSLINNNLVVNHTRQFSDVFRTTLNRSALIHNQVDTYTKRAVLDSITIDDITIKYIYTYSDNPLELSNNYLKKIQVEQKKKLIKETNFSYENLGNVNKRTFLKSVTTSGGENTSFEYYSTSEFPPYKNSYYTTNDLGFWNGVMNPDYDTYLYQSYPDDLTKYDVGLLKKVTYSTKGAGTYFYENGDYSKIYRYEDSNNPQYLGLYDESKTVNAPRIYKKIESDGQTPLETTYTYKKENNTSSGIIDGVLVYNQNLNANNSYEGSTFSRKNLSANLLGQNSLHYSEVKVANMGKGYTKYTFTDRITNPDTLSSKATKIPAYEDDTQKKVCETFNFQNRDRLFLSKQYERGKILKEEIFNNDNTKLKEISYKYTNFLKKLPELSISEGCTNCKISDLNYYVKTIKHSSKCYIQTMYVPILPYLQTSQTTKEYYGSTIIETKKTSTYNDNANYWHPHPVQESIVTPLGTSIKKYLYPSDFKKPVCGGGRICPDNNDIVGNQWNTYGGMVASNLFLPILEISKNEDNKYSLKENLYTSGITFYYALKKVRYSLLNAPIDFTNYSIASSDTTDEINFDLHDSKANPLQTTGKDNIPVTTIYGYNQTLPIATISGISYEQLMQVFGLPATPAGYLSLDIVSKSNADKDEASEQILLNALETFRKNPALTGYQISTYTYNPLIGVTSITPPSGIRESYIYDTANRLEKVVDVNGNVLKEMKYNYKN
ncbi:hypothetical protein [Chryseobacterium flavum]|uniref:hypothetical protein n=1 Tax=Chryseobacterium flavum TaxID=415851 RepID=UPI0028AF252A|nr:hypothetical protein [Chryseobacterium flavum]